MATPAPPADDVGARPSGSPARTLAVLVGVALLLLVGVVGGYRLGTSQTSTTPPEPAPVPVTLKPQPIDVGFAQDMSDHHDQAVQMALLALDKADSQAVRTLAIEIVASQRRENGILEQFLRDRGVARADPQRTVMEWMHEPVPHDRMPGLATNDQIVALTEAEGPAFDQQFVDLMIRHHEGGIHMAQYAAEQAETQYIRDFARRVITAQNHELTDLRQLSTTG